MNVKNISAERALELLKEGNDKYIVSEKHHGDISWDKRLYTHTHGQRPFAIIITCSDSRVIPESIFMQGIGDLFVIRVAGNVIGDFELGSIEYAVEHLGCNLIMVMGHTRCGAIASSLDGKVNGYVGKIIDEIQYAIKDTTDHLKATKLNVENSISKIIQNEVVKEHMKHGLHVVGSVYHTNSSHIEIMK